MKFELWENLSRKSPVAQFLETEVEKKSALKIVERFELFGKYRVEELLRTKYFKKIERDLYSVKIKLDKIFYRFFGTFRTSKFYILHSIKKKSNKIPLKELGVARQRIHELDYQIKEDLLK